jgi:hypothetical protein
MRPTRYWAVDESVPGRRPGLRRSREREVGRVDVECFPRNTAGLPAAHDRQVGQIGRVEVEHEYRMPRRGGERVDSGVRWQRTGCSLTTPSSGLIGSGLVVLFGASPVIARPRASPRTRERRLKSGSNGPALRAMNRMEMFRGRVFFPVELNELADARVLDARPTATLQKFSRNQSSEEAQWPQVSRPSSFRQWSRCSRPL